MDAPQGEAGIQFRERRLKAAVIASLFSKISTALVALVAIPVGIRALGANDYALYAVLISSLTWLRIATGGIGPALTINIANAAAKGDREKERRVFASGMLPYLAASVFLILLCCGYAAWGPLKPVIGDIIQFNPSEARWGIGILGILIALQLVFSGIDSVQVGYQETHRAYIRQSAGNALCLIAIFAVSKWHPTVNGLILAANLPLVLAQAINVVFFLRTKPQLKFGKGSFDRGIFWVLAKDAFAYALSGGLASYLCLQFPVAYSARMVEPAQVVLIAVSLSLVTQLYGMIQMIIIPLRPALADAEAKGEYSWIRRAYNNALRYTMAYAALVACVMFGLGGWLLQRVLHVPTAPSAFFLAAWSAHFVLYCWENLHFSILYGIRHRNLAVGLWLGRTLLGCCFLWVALENNGASGLYMVMALSILLVSAIPLFTLMRKVLSAGGSEKGNVTETQPIP